MTTLDGTYTKSAVNSHTNIQSAPPKLASALAAAAASQSGDSKAAVQTPAQTPTQLSRDHILAATAQCLQENGYDGTTIRKIAKRLDCAVGSIYRYFRDKRDLLYAVAQQKLESIVQLAESGAPFELCLRKYHEKARQSGEEYHLMFWLAQDGDDKSHALVVPAIVENIIDQWARMLNDRSAAQRCWATLHGHIVLGSDNEMVMQSIREMVGRGQSIASKPAQPPVTPPTPVAEEVTHIPPTQQNVVPADAPTPQAQADIQVDAAIRDDVTLL